MYILILALVILLILKPHPLPKPYKCLPWDKCPDCHGTGKIEIGSNDYIDCPCTTEWR